MRNEDRDLVGAVVARQIDRSGRSRVEFTRQTGVSRATLYRVIDGDRAVSQRTMRALEGALSLPYDTLAYIALHDWAALQEIGAPSDLVLWARRNAGTSKESEGQSGQNRHP